MCAKRSQRMKKKEEEEESPFISFSFRTGEREGLG
jgi:hypothetical protein